MAQAKRWAQTGLEERWAQARLEAHANSEGKKAVDNGTYDVDGRNERLTFNSKETEPMIPSFLTAPMVHTSAAVCFLTATVEYLAAEVLELSGNAAREGHAEIVRRKHLLLAIRHDEELAALFPPVDGEQEAADAVEDADRHAAKEERRKAKAEAKKARREAHAANGPLHVAIRLYVFTKEISSAIEEVSVEKGGADDFTDLVERTLDLWQVCGIVGSLTRALNLCRCRHCGRYSHPAPSPTILTLLLAGRGA